MLDELPRREPGRTQIPSPRARLVCQPPPNLTELTRIAEALREWQTTTNGSPQ